MYTSVLATRPSARTTAFQKQHLLEFGLKVNQVDETTGHVSSVRCQFCVYYGHERVIGQKRHRQPTTIKHWDSPFHAELYKKHHDTQHFMQWNKYQSLSHDEKVAQFASILQFKETLHSHFGQKNMHLLFNFNASIINVIISDMFFHPDDHGGVSRAKALNLFKQNTEDMDYTVTIKNSMQFHLIIDYIDTGLSFQQVNNVIHLTKKHTNLTAIGSI